MNKKFRKEKGICGKYLTTFGKNKCNYEIPCDRGIGIFIDDCRGRICPDYETIDMHLQNKSGENSK